MLRFISIAATPSVSYAELALSGLRIITLPFQWIGALITERRALTDLSSLDDAMLRDIGLCRSDLNGAAYWPLASVDTETLESVARSRFTPMAVPPAPARPVLRVISDQTREE